jgi:hypothetical protein
MIYSAPGESFFAILTNAPPGVAASLQVQIERQDGSTHTPPSGENIVEIEPGIYGTARTAPTTTAKYVVVWKHGSVTTGEELFVTYDLPGPRPPADVGVDEVGALLRARTKDTLGNEIGTFTPDTRPTDTQVTNLIVQATGHVKARIGGELCESGRAAGLEADANRLIALYAAMLVELSYFPEQVERDHSPYSRFKALWDEGIASLIENERLLCGDDEMGRGRPAYSFDTQVDDIGKDGPMW